MVGLPQINIIFKGLSDTAIKRSTNGVACIIFKEVAETPVTPAAETPVTPAAKTSITNNVYEIKNISEITKTDFTNEEYIIIEDIFKSDILKLKIIKIAKNKTFNDIKNLISKDINWIAYINMEAIGTEQKLLIDYVKLENKNKERIKKLKMIGWTILETDSDDMHIVNFTNESVTKKDGTVVSGYLFLGRILGILTSAPMDRSVTNKAIKELKEVEMIANPDEAINRGDFILINTDDFVRIGRGVNTLQTLKEGQTDDMKYITIVETMDIIQEDIIKTFRNSYLGKFKNNYNNQVLLIVAIKQYFESLENLDILDINYNNNVTVDIEKQRKAYIDIGKIEAKEWKDLEVKNNTFKTYVFLLGNIKILNAIEDLTFIVNLQ